MRYTTKQAIKHCLLMLTVVSSAAFGSVSLAKPANEDPQGFWVGTTASGYDLAAVVLENGDYYSLYALDDIIIGANYGSLSATGNTFSGNVEDIYVPKSQTNSGTVSGTFVPKTSLQGVASYVNNKLGAFTTTYRASYDTPATLSAIAGQYAGPIFRSTAAARLDIDQNGIVTGSTSRVGSNLPVCIINGTVEPRASGKNVYDLTLAWSDNPDPSAPRCCLKGSTICATNTPRTGIAVIYGTYIYTAWINAAKSSGFLWRGAKQ